jgi:chromosome segregation ATPase
MWFFIAESILVIIISLLAGCVAGWLIWGGERKKTKDASTIDVSSSVLPSSGTAFLSSETPLVANGSDSELRAELDDLHAELADTQAELEEARSALEDARIELGDTHAELGDHRERVMTRDADVSRLKAKLRKAVEEIERRTALANVARQELAEERTKFSEQLNLIGNGASSDAAPHGGAVGLTGAGHSTGPFDVDNGSSSALTEEQIEERVRARTAQLQLRFEATERRMDQAIARADEAERELASARLGLRDAQTLAHEREAGLRREAQERAEQLESETASVRNSAETRLKELETELQKAKAESAEEIERLQGVVIQAQETSSKADRALSELTEQVGTIRSLNATHLEQVHNTIDDLQSRLDAAKSMLVGHTQSQASSAGAQSSLVSDPGHDKRVF